MVNDDRKAWEYEYDENPRDNFATFDNRNIPDGKPERGKGLFRHLAIRKRLIVLFFGLIGCTFLLGYLWPGKYPYFTVPAMHSVIKKYLPKHEDETGSSRRGSEVPAVVRKEAVVQQPMHREYTKADIEQAKREVLLKRRVESTKQQVIEKVEREKPVVAIKQGEVVPQRYIYEIQLYSGGRIFTDNAVMTEETVSFEDSGGLWVSIDKNEVKKMIRTRVAEGNP